MGSSKKLKKIDPLSIVDQLTQLFRKITIYDMQMSQISINYIALSRIMLTDNDIDWILFSPTSKYFITIKPK